MLFSVGDISRATGHSTSRIQHIVTSRRIDPVQRAGGIRLFDQAAHDRIIIELANLPKPGRPVKQLVAAE